MSTGTRQPPCAIVPWQWHSTHALLLTALTTTIATPSTTTKARVLGRCGYKVIEVGGTAVPGAMLKTQLDALLQPCLLQQQLSMHAHMATLAHAPAPHTENESKVSSGPGNPKMHSWRVRGLSRQWRGIRWQSKHKPHRDTRPLLCALPRSRQKPRAARHCSTD